MSKNFNLSAKLREENIKFKLNYFIYKQKI